MHLKYCPNCGHPLRPGQDFCSNCGYNLITHQMPRHQSGMRMPHRRPFRPMSRMPHRNVGIIIALLVIILIGGGGYFAYNQIVGGSSPTQQQDMQGSNSTSQNNSSNNNSSTNSSTQSTPEISQSTAMNILNKVFNDAKSKVDKNDDDNMASYFENGDRNNDYKVLYNWANDQYHSESLDGLDMGVSGISGVSAGSNGTSKVACHVKYQFHYDNSVKHQTFAWYGKFKKLNGQWELVSLKPDNNPISSY